MPDGPVDVSSLPPHLDPPDRRSRYANAISAWHRDPELPLYAQGADAVMAVADAELREQQDRQIEQSSELLHKLADVQLENERLREQLRKAERAANLLAADHRAVERVQRRLDAWEQRLPANVAKATVIDVLRQDLDGAA
jgi:hypothetical protein